jgi:NADH-quinone oxidoreductase subunit I
MGYLVDTVKALATTLRTMFRRPATFQFPEVERPRPPRYRVSFALPLDEHGEMACLGCLTCEKICPSGVIRVKAAPKRESPVTGKKRAYADDFTLDLSACIFCELCVQVCNSDAILMVRTPEEPTFTREDLVLTLDRLLQNGRDRSTSWSTGARLMEMQEGPPREKPAKADKPKPVAPPAAAAPADPVVAPAAEGKAE